MQFDNQEGVWFPEPEIDDTTHGKRGEHKFKYIKRSTVQRAINYRKSLNYHLSKMPQKFQEKFINEARKQWQNAEFELIVGRFLQVLGAELSIEHETESGKRPDFTATFFDEKVTVEATVPSVNREVGKEVKRRNPLLNIIETYIPSGWEVSVRNLPNIGLSDPQKEFKHVLSEIFSNINQYKDNDEVKIIRELDSGVMDLTLYRRIHSIGQISIEPGIRLRNNTESRIIKAIKKKKKQVQESIFPVILAIHASGLASKWVDFDNALFRNSDDFRTHGYFYTRRKKSPIYAGVLAFINVGILYGNDPVFYKNTHFEGSLPSAIACLEQRYLDIDSKRIVSKQAQIKNIMEKLRTDAIK